MRAKLAAALAYSLICLSCFASEYTNDIDKLTVTDRGVIITGESLSFYNGSIKAEIYNGNPSPCSFDLVFKFQDKNGYVIFDRKIFGCHLSANSKDTFSDSILVDRTKYDMTTTYTISIQDFK